MKEKNQILFEYFPGGWKSCIFLVVIVIISALVYLPVFQSELLAWDDSDYIKNNPLILSINLKEIFSNVVMGNYHPVTILVYAIEYQLFGLNSAGYHAVNLLLHLLNVILVFYTIYLLSGKAIVGLIASFLFGVHPLHVESVAWAAELKDMLYTFFFLASYIFYLKYIKDLNRRYFYYALLLFAVSLLSKAMAAPLPLVLILTDYLRGREINRKTLLEKAPFFLLALAFGAGAVLVQKYSGAIHLSAVLTFPQSIVFASYGFINYLVKLILPFNLSAFYPYPVNQEGIFIPTHYYFYVPAVLALIAYICYTYKFTKKIIFGAGFFILMIMLVLQLLPVGKAIMADRYTYVASIGIFYLAGEGIVLLWEKNLKIYAVSLLSLAGIIFSAQTYARCGVWQNDMTLWNDVISQNKEVAESYYKGYFFKDAMVNGENVEKVPELKSDNAADYFTRASEFVIKGKNKEAIDDLNKAIELKPDLEIAYNKRGIALFNLKHYEEALSDFTKAVSLKPDYAEAYNNRGIVFFNGKKYTDALSDFNKAIGLKPDYALAYNNIGNVFFEEKKYAEAIANYSKAIDLKDNYSQAFYKRGLAESYSGNKDAACKDLEKAAMLGFLPAAEAFGKLCKQ